MGSNQKIYHRTIIIMKLYIISSVVVSLLDSSLAQLKFGGSSSSSSSGSNGATITKQSGTDTRFFTGDEAIDGGILGLGAGLLGGAVLGGALNGGGNGCGRRRRQADDTNTKFLGALLGGGSGGGSCGRKKRQAPGEDQVGVRFFGLETLLGGGNNNCCNCGGNGYNSGNNNGYNHGNNNGYNNGNNNGFNNGYNNGNNNGYNNGNNNGYNNGNSNVGGGFNSGVSSSRCQCNYNLTFQDKYGQTHGACKRGDETGRRWCYTTGYGCSDARQSQRFPSNPWSYQACGSQGKK